MPNRRLHQPESGTAGGVGSHRRPDAGERPRTEICERFRLASDLKGLRPALTGAALPARTRLAPGRKWRFATAACVAVIATVAGAYFFLHRGIPSAAKRYDRRRRIREQDPDPVFDGTLRQALAVELEQSPFLSICSRGANPADAASDEPDRQCAAHSRIALEICERSGGTAVLEGSIASLGNQYVLWLRARSCRVGDVLFEQQAQAGKKEEVLKALGQVAREFRIRAGEPLSDGGEAVDPTGGSHYDLA